MRFYSLILVSIIGLSPVPGNAGRLVGDWYQDDTSSDSINDRRAFSQPVSQSTDTSQVTLGIQSPGSMDFVDFYLVISNEPALSSCLYTVNKIAIDSRSYVLRSTTDSSDLFHLTTRSDTEQKQLWRDFKKGQNLTLKVHQACDFQGTQSSEDNTFVFSLRGSSAAYSFVTEQEADTAQIQSDVKTRETATASESAPAEIIVLIVLIVTVIVVMLWIIRSLFLPSSILKGWFGEKKTGVYIWLSLDAKIYHCFHDVIIPAVNGTTQIDHLLVSPYGLFIVETKNIKGWIFGSEDQAKWTNSIYGKKYSFQNPLRQTFRQKKILSEFLGIDESIIHTVIFFVGDCKFKTHLPSNVIKSGLGRYIKRFQTPILSPNEIHQISGKLGQHISESTVTTRDHVRSLRERHSSTTVCPGCGSSLVERMVKQGPKAGSKFPGCESYPKSRFTKNA